MKSKAEAKLRRNHGGFMIGDLILVEEYYERFKDNQKGQASYVRRDYPTGRYFPSPKNAEPRAGWIVGFTSLRPGKLVWLGCDEGWAYEPEGSVSAVLVRFWPHLKPVPVPYDGFREWREGDPEPHSHIGSPKQKKEAQDAYKKWADCFPRNDKGQFKSP